MCPFLGDPKRSRPHGMCDVCRVGRCTILNIKYNFNIIIMQFYAYQLFVRCIILIL